MKHTKLDKLNANKGNVIDRMKALQHGQREYLIDVFAAALESLNLADTYWSMDDDDRDMFYDLVAMHFES